jgi:hypothetical protein
MVALIGDTNFAMNDTERFSCGLDILGVPSIRLVHLISHLDDLLRALHRPFKEIFE